MKIDKISLFMFVISIVILYFLYINAPIITLKEAKSKVGEIVIVHGKVINTSKTKNNNTKLLITDGSDVAYLIIPLRNISCKYIKARGYVLDSNKIVYIFVKKYNILQCS